MLSGLWAPPAVGAVAVVGSFRMADGSWWLAVGVWQLGTGLWALSLFSSMRFRLIELRCSKMRQVECN